MSGRPWRSQEIEYVKINRKQGAKVIGKHLFRSEQAVKHLALRYHINLTPPNKRKTRWTKYEDEIIIKNKDMPLAELQELIPRRSIPSLSNRKSRLGVAHKRCSSNPLWNIMQRQKNLKEGVEDG